MGVLVHSLRTILTTATGFALLTVYIYFHASTETFVVYLIALAIWAALFGYCVRGREKRTNKAGTSLHGLGR